MYPLFKPLCCKYIDVKGKEKNKEQKDVRVQATLKKKKTKSIKASAT